MQTHKSHPLLVELMN